LGSSGHFGESVFFLELWVYALKCRNCFNHRCFEMRLLRTCRTCPRLSTKRSEKPESDGSGVYIFHRRPCRGTGNERKFPLQNHQRANAPRSQWRVGPVWLARDPPTTCDARRVVWKWGWLPGVLEGPSLAAPMAPWAACGVGVGGHVRIAPAPFLMRVGNEGGQSTF
jgi:hypothetical protein